MVIVIMCVISYYFCGSVYSQVFYYGHCNHVRDFVLLLLWSL